MFSKLALPPGLDRTGTEYQSAARFYDANLVRWFDGRLQPIGGWTQLGTALTGRARGIHTWVDNSANGRAALGTQSNLYTLTPAGVLTDITPVSGWTAQPEGSRWTLDNAGALLVGVNDAHGTIFTWLPGDAAASALANAPSCDSVVVTNEGILMALGASGNPRLVAWCDRDDYTDWTAGFADLAGDLSIQAKAGIQCARTIRAGVLIWTSEDLHIARYAGLPDVYGIEPVAGDCGAISRACVAMVDDMAFWMGASSFHVCNGGSYVDKLQCAIHSDVFDKLDRDNAHKVSAQHVSEFNEIWWEYPHIDDATGENSRIAVFNYAEQHWTYHRLARDCGAPRGAGFKTPLIVRGSVVYAHETGTAMPGGGDVYARSGPVEIGNGERVAHIKRCIPDEKAAGDVDLYFYTKFFPNGAEFGHGPFNAANPIQLRLTGRQVAVEFRQLVANPWRVGDYRFELGAGGIK